MANFKFGLGIDKKRRIADGVSDRRDEKTLIGLYQLAFEKDCAANLCAWRQFNLPGEDSREAEKSELPPDMQVAAAVLRDTYGHIGAVVVYAESEDDIKGLSAMLKTYKSIIQVVAAVPFGANADLAEYADETFVVEPAQTAIAIRDCAKYEDIVVGRKSGAVLHAALQVASRNGLKNKNVVAVLPDLLPEEEYDSVLKD